MDKLKQQSKYSLIFSLCLMTIILVIPSLIVLATNHSQTSEEQIKPTSNMTNQPMDSSPNINVYRTMEEKIDSIPLEDYVLGVVAAEMPASFELEALKAQALGARTFIINRMFFDSANIPNIPDDAHITDNINFHQAYKSKEELAEQWGIQYESNITKIQNAVMATQGQILVYDDKPIDPLYFSTSNGYTENSEDYWSTNLPYLRSVESPWDKESPKFNDQKMFSIDEIEQKLNIKLDRYVEVIGEKKLTKSQRVATIEIGDKEFSGVFIRENLQLASNDFDIQQKDDNFIFTTRGNGHGVGMSQYGANGMAKKGSSYQDIVKYYYQGIEIADLESLEFYNSLAIAK